ncbi:alpha/beta hydrolase family protein [Lutimonas vermicola]|uniref:Prolyl oligopeptidase family serine peptidase n=1 Tax=Lutimonas vermicola TaxID=414288 RepID=A0ABU9L0A7_9FLAO
MKNISLLIALLCFQLGFMQQTDPAGIYRGQFQHGNFQSDIEIDLSLVNDQYQIKFNSFSQNAFGIPAGDIKISGETLEFALQSDYYRYDFSLANLGGSRLTGTLKVDDKQYDIQLDKNGRDLSKTIESKDIRFRSQGLLLYGTIYYPVKPNGKAIYLVTSSGGQDRSSSRAEAILFSQKGYISFHIDKRGTGISDGNWQLANIPELCEDDLHAIEFLHQSEKIEYTDIGIKGSSQGGAKVPYLLKKQPQLAFGIVVSCPASTLLESDLNFWRNRNIEAIGIKDVDAAMSMQNTVFQYIAGNISKQSLEEDIEKNSSQNWFNKVWVPELDQVDFDAKLNYSPLPYFKDNTSAMLIIEGTNDGIIPAQSLKTIKKTIGRKGNRKNKFVALKGADHSMMFKGKSDFPYWSSLHPDYMESMLKWIGKL